MSILAAADICSVWFSLHKPCFLHRLSSHLIGADLDFRGIAEDSTIFYNLKPEPYEGLFLRLPLNIINYEDELHSALKIRVTSGFSFGQELELIVCRNLFQGLQRIGNDPVNGGGFSDVWLGKLGNGIKVAIKTVRAFEEEQIQIVKKVNPSNLFGNKQLYLQGN